MTTTPQSPILFVGVSEAARMLGIGKTLLYEQIAAGKFPHKRIGTRIVISIKVLEKMAEPDDNSPTRL
jgi:excisionase family DNA binding protein